MPRPSMILALMLALAAPSMAAVWTPIDSGVESTLNDLYFHDAHNGIAVGWDGTVLLTTDGGETWVGPTSSPPGTVALNGVSFGDALRGIIVGHAGSAWWTDDGGQNWHEGTSGTAENLQEVAMLGPATGLAVGWGGTILRTIDGGDSWTSMTSGTTEPLWGVAALDDSTAVAVGDYTILRTIDGGANWAEISHPAPITWFYDVDFSNPLDGLAVGDYATVLSTDDGGLTWTLEHNTENDADFLLSVAMLDASSALAVGWFDSGAQNALRTSNGGQDWDNEATDYGRSMRSVAYVEKLSIATGLEGMVFKTQDGPVSADPPVRSIILRQNHPNPFNPSTRISFSLAEACEISLVIHEQTGRTVRTLLKGPAPAGPRSVDWDGRDDAGRPVASGTYLYELKAGHERAARKMVLVR